MPKKNSFLFFLLFLSHSLSAQPVQKGPYTVKILTENVYNIEDANDSNPAGIVTGEEIGYFTRISKTKDYGLTVTRLVVDLGEGSKITEKDLDKDTFKVTGFNKSNKVTRDIKGLSVTDRRGNNVESGSHVTIDLDFGFDADPANAYFLVVTLNKDMGKYHKGTRFIQQGRTLRR